MEESEYDKRYLVGFLACHVIGSRKQLSPWHFSWQASKVESAMPNSGGERELSMSEINIPRDHLL